MSGARVPVSLKRGGAHHREGVRTEIRHKKRYSLSRGPLRFRARERPCRLRACDHGWAR